MATRGNGKGWVGMCLPQTALSTAGLILTTLLHLFVFFTLTGWIDGTADGISIILDIVSLVAIILYLLMLVSRARQLMAHNYVSLFVEDIELKHAMMGTLAYFSAGFVNFIFTIDKTQADYTANMVWAAILYAIHLYFLAITLWILLEIIADFASSGIEQRRTLNTDAVTTNDRELYGLFPPVTAAVVISLLVLFVLHVVAALIVMGVVDGTSDTMRQVFTYVSLGLGLFYLIVMLLQYANRSMRIMRLARDIEFSHTLYGLFFFISAGTLYIVFTNGRVPADYVATPLLAAELIAIYVYFLLGTMALIANGAFNMPAKGNEERRVSNLITTTS